MSAASLQIAPAAGRPISSMLPELDDLEQAVARLELQVNTERERVLVFDPDGLLDGVVQAAAAGLACDVEVIGSMAALAESPPGSVPAMAILGGDVTRAAALLRARPGGRQMPFAAVGGPASLLEAASAVHAGATLCLAAPLDMESMRGAIETLRRARRPERPRVLVVDDEAAAEHLAAMLVEIDMSASSVGDARGLLARLHAFEPDALVMEQELPGLSGLEICRALRSMPRWRGLPILLLAGFVDDEMRLKAIDAGADDLLQWPLTRTELSSLLRARIDRSRQLQERSDRDPLTGLLNRRAFLEALQGRIADCSRHRRPLTLGLIDLDHFKLVNDRHGHLAGDRVLAGIGRHFAQRLRLEDMRGRWGGEELVVALPGEELGSAHRVIDRLRAEFSRVGFEGGDAQFATTFSAGLAALPEGGASVELLVRLADERLYRAKRAGRNCVVSA